MASARMRNGPSIESRCETVRDDIAHGGKDADCQALPAGSPQQGGMRGDGLRAIFNGADGCASRWRSRSGLSRRR